MEVDSDEGQRYADPIKVVALSTRHGHARRRRDPGAASNLNFIAGQTRM
jgi:hypothetical protein